MENGIQDGASNFKVLVQGFAMIIASEIGDKTFLIAAILAMRHPRAVVFSGAFGALAVMSVLSAALGHVLPTLIPKSWTQFAASVLFFVFGAKMLQEGREMRSGSAKIEEEMREAEEEIEEDDALADGTGVITENGHAIPLEELERGEVPTEDAMPATPKSPSRARKSEKETWREGARNFFSLLLGPVFVQAFALTFLGEWGDRSQIATIALGAAHNVYVVSLGTTIGHACCTAFAVIGGRYISTKISVKHVTLGGAVLFLLFGFVYLYEAFKENSAEHVLVPHSHEDASDLLH
ncbi:vacuole protein [Fomitiporia mediterranea MF3/22]|uniref:GDT1 family protein n=1 Tax=Fomitiporia mediterranea (strain MF3/22) TaxID=694068 RepID=R7SGS8_FOMME|nr:vacuole protein [Fomitiporia mediterranea MF3/22]EJC97620.1 vacuole protein [Fomitiporia mediterranea MF3/22]